MLRVATWETVRIAHVLIYSDDLYISVRVIGRSVWFSCGYEAAGSEEAYSASILRFETAETWRQATDISYLYS